MMAPAARAAWAGGAVVATAIAAAASDIPKPEQFWFASWMAWIGFALAMVAFLGLLKKIIWPATSAELRRALAEPDTRRAMRAIILEDFKDRVEFQQLMRRDIDANMDRLLMVENSVLQQGKAIQQMPDMVATLGRIEMQIETQTETWRSAIVMIERRGSQIDRIEGRLEAWDGGERRTRPR